CCFIRARFVWPPYYGSEKRMDFQRSLVPPVQSWPHRHSHRVFRGYSRHAADAQGGRRRFIYASVRESSDGHSSEGESSVGFLTMILFERLGLLLLLAFILTRIPGFRSLLDREMDAKTTVMHAIVF